MLTQVEREMGIKASDFRRAWPDALAVAQSEVLQITREQILLNDKLETMLGRMIKLTPLAAQMIDVARKHHEEVIERATQRSVTRIEAAQTSFIAAQDKFLEAFKVEREALQLARNAGDLQRTDIDRAQRELDDSRASFRSRGFWARVFNRV